MKRVTTLPDSVAIVSGGLDSTTLVYDMITKGYTPHLLSFNYGQRHKKELQYASLLGRTLGLSHDIVDLTGLTHLISNSALTSIDHPARTGKSPMGTIEVPEGHYAEDNMKATVVPNRNMIMLSIAAGVAVNNSYRTIATGVHAGDHFVYPDCRPNFINAAAHAIELGNADFHRFDYDEIGWAPIYAPFIDSSKADIAYRALELGVPLHLTWSCYKGGDKHCGKCGTCVERLEAIAEAVKRLDPNDLSYGVIIEKHQGRIGQPIDKTEYEDDEFWKTAIREQRS